MLFCVVNYIHLFKKEYTKLSFHLCSPFLTSEPYGGEQSSIQDYHYLPLVSKLFCHPLPKQEGPARREDLLLALGGLFP